MKFHILSIFPDILDSYLNAGILRRAQEKNLITICRHDLRNWTSDKHRTVDDTPYGGGAGMLMKIEPLYKALTEIGKTNKKIASSKKKVILLSAAGKKWTQSMAKKYSKLEEVTFVCGRYEGVDARISKFVDDEISIGDYVLTGGELPAMVIIDSITRLLPGVLGNKESLSEETHSSKRLKEYPQYTRPEVFKIKNKSYRVPKVLLSGNHQEIKAWRDKKSKKAVSRLSPLSSR